MGALGPNLMLPGEGTTSQESCDWFFVLSHSKWGIGPRVDPSHSLQPIAQPLVDGSVSANKRHLGVLTYLENQKQACPFAPDRLRPGSVRTASSLGKGHHGSKGTGLLIGPPQGISFESMAFRAGGKVMAPWDWTATGRTATATTRRRRLAELITCIIAEAR